MTRAVLSCFDCLLVLLREWREDRYDSSSPQFLYMQCMCIQHTGGLNPLPHRTIEGLNQPDVACSTVFPGLCVDGDDMFVSGPVLAFSLPVHRERSNALHESKPDDSC